jgi:hypothetical protein
MAKRRAAGRRPPTKAARKTTKSRRSGKHPRPKRVAKPRPRTRKAAPATRRAARKTTRTTTRTTTRPVMRSAAPAKVPRLDRPRRTLQDIVPTPPSSLDMKRGGSAVRSGRADVEHSKLEHQGMSPSITGGDVDVDIEDAYFTGDGAPGGDNPTPDQEIVDDIGRALGVQYADSEELRAADKVVERDKHRWELDPASSEDYKERKKTENLKLKT